LPEIGIFGTPTYAVALSGIDEMMNVLPDNDGNEITAEDVRNVVFTLYDDIQSMSASTFFYTNPNGVTNPVGNWTTGKTFSNVGLQDLFNGIFYKDSDPSAGLVNIPNTITFEFKQPNTPIVYPYNTGFDEEDFFQLRWTATKGTYNLQPIGTITRSPQPVVPEVPLAGDPLFTVPVPVNGGTDITPITKPRLNVSNTYTFTFKDINGKPASKQLTIGYGFKLYWGRKSNKSPITSSSQITSLDGAGLDGSGGFTTTFVRNYNGIDGSGDFLCWAFPSSFGEPKFFVSNFRQSAFTKINSQFAFVNQYGYQTNYDVWVSDTQQNSPIDDIKITL
jgi:hypothetical protein